jgi:hypothetical protein
VERRDYIQKQIELIAHFVARILGLRRENPELAAKEAEQALASVTGFPLGMLLRLGPATALGMLGKERARGALPLFNASVEALRSAGRHGEADELARLAECVAKALGAAE